MAAEVGRMGSTRVDFEFPCDVGEAVGAKRRRPIVAIVLQSAASVPVNVTGGRDEDAVAVGASEFESFRTVQRDPFPGAVVTQFLDFFHGGHACAVAPVGRGCVVGRLQGGQVVGVAVVAENFVVAVLCQLRIAVTVGVGLPAIFHLGLRLAPGEELAVVGRLVGTDVARSPLQATRQTKVDPVAGGNLAIARGPVI